MTNLKSIIDLPMTENTNGVNLIVNDNGVAKQADLDAVRTEQEYDLVFKMNRQPQYGPGILDYIEFMEKIDQEKLTSFWSKVEKGQKVKVLLEIFNFIKGDYNYYTYLSYPMSFQAHWSDNDDYRMGWATTVIGAEEEGGFAQYISITVNKTEIKAAYGRTIEG